MHDYIEEQQKQEKDKTRRKIFKDVFDDRTEKNLRTIERRGNLDYIIGPIAKGKEANLFIGKKAKDYICVKIYRIETTNFHNRRDYIDDEVLGKIAKNPIKRIYAWCEREYFNLKYSHDNKVQVPKALDQENNVIVMKLIGSKDIPYPTLKYAKDTKKNIKEIYKQYIVNMHKLLYKAKMVHADLSEYNMIFFNDKLYFIDMGQGVSTNYPKAKEFLERDFKTIVKFFRNNGLKITLEEIKDDIKRGII